MFGGCFINVSKTPIGPFKHDNKIYKQIKILSAGRVVRYHCEKNTIIKGKKGIKKERKKYNPICHSCKPSAISLSVYIYGCCGYIIIMIYDRLRPRCFLTITWECRRWCRETVDVVPMQNTRHIPRTGRNGRQCNILLAMLMSAAMLRAIYLIYLGLVSNLSLATAPGERPAVFLQA